MATPPKQAEPRSRYRVLLHLAAAIGLGIILLLLTHYWLLSSTKHGETIKVPALTGKSVTQAQAELEQLDLQFAVRDSTYVADIPPLTIVEQQPKPEASVKSGRRIYLTVNSASAPLIALPNLIDFSYRSALQQLQTLGLEAGEITYVPDIAENIVKELRYGGRNLEPGTKVPKGSAINLVLGDGGKSRVITIPDVTGRSYDEGAIILKGNFLKLGTIAVSGIIGDTTQAIIYKQEPRGGTTDQEPNTAVNLWIMNQEDYNDLFPRQ